MRDRERSECVVNLRLNLCRSLYIFAKLPHYQLSVGLRLIHANNLIS